MLVLFIIIAVLVLLLLVWVGVELEYGEQGFGLWVRVAFFHVRVIPGREGRKKPPGPPSRKPAKQKPKLDVGNTLALVKVMAPLGLNALSRFRRRLSIDELTLRYVAASGDPYSAAMQYGYVCAGVHTLLGLMNGYLRIQELNTDISLDFDLEKPVIFVRFAVSLAIWEILYIGVMFGLEFLKVRRNLPKTGAAAADSAEKESTTERNSEHG